MGWGGVHHKNVGNRPVVSPNGGKKWFLGEGFCA